MKIDRDEKQTIIYYQQTFEPEAGKRVLDNLKKLSRVLLATVPMDNDGKLDPYMMAYQNGQRSVLVHIYAKLRKDPYEVKQSKAINIERENDG